MAQVKVRLANENKKGIVDIHLTYKCEDKKVFVYSTKEKIHKTHWSDKNQRVIPSATGSGRINNLIDLETERIKTAITSIRARQEKVTRSALQMAFNGATGDFWAVVDTFTKAPPLHLTKSSLEVYALTFKHLKDFEKELRQKITFRGIDQEFADKYVKFRRESVRVIAQHPKKEKKVSAFWGEDRAVAFSDELEAEGYTTVLKFLNTNDSTIEKELKHLKGFLTYAHEAAKVIKEKPSFKISAKGIDSDEIALSEKEIELLYKHTRDLNRESDGVIELEGKLFVRFQVPYYEFFKKTYVMRNKTVPLESFQEIVNYFVIGTRLGQRVSDLVVRPEISTEIEGVKYLNLTIRKTVKKTWSTIVPVFGFGEKILDQYDWKIKDFSEVLMNLYVKQAARMAGIEGDCICRTIEGGKLVENIYKRWEMIKTHTMRRSWATNLLERGVPAIYIQRGGGWKTEKSMMKYLKISQQQAATKIAQHLRRA